MFNFFKKRKLQKQIERHSAGATVVHKSPFDTLTIPHKTNELSKEFINKWISPFYMEQRLMDNNNYESNFISIKDEINPEVIKQLLGYFDWRARITGAYFASIMDYKEFDNFIGINLVKSEVSYAGEGYLIALASFNTKNSIDYIIKYLDYYLCKIDLWFDQGDAMAALIWLDNKNATELLKKHNFMDSWENFIKNKPNWKLDHYIEFFNHRMNNIESIRNKIKNDM